LTKLHENTFRAVNLALANEFAEICSALRIDPIEVIDAASTKPYGYLAHYPGPGVGGHCIPCDPHYLLRQLRASRVATPLIEQAMSGIAARPRRVIERLAEVLSGYGYGVAGARVIVVGVAYKPGLADLRGSPALEIISRLRGRGADVDYWDPLVPALQLPDGYEMKGRSAPLGQDYDLALVHTLQPGILPRGCATARSFSTPRTASRVHRAARCTSSDHWKRTLRRVREHGCADYRGAGFIGSELATLLTERGSRVVVLDHLSTGRLANIEHLLPRPGFTFVEGSVLDREVVDALTGGVDTIFHLAAAVGVKTIMDDPLESLHTNIDGTATILAAADRHRVPVLITSTSEVYGKNTANALREDDDRILGSSLNSRWSYAEAKAVDESLALAYWRQRGLPTVIVRLFNTVGPRQTGRYGMVIPRFVDQALRGEPLTVFGDGTQTRCFCYVGDAVDALRALANHPDARGSTVNIGRPEEISIRALAERVIELSRSTSAIEYVPYEQAYGDGIRGHVAPGARHRTGARADRIRATDDAQRHIADGQS
jgi:UDP-glucose 4-epimerase